MRVHLQRLHRITVMNMKGGCGKSTISTNLSAYFALQGYSTSIADYDIQGSSLDWLKRRDESLPYVQGIDGAKNNRSTTRSWQLKPPENTDILINDIPAATNVMDLSFFLSRTDTLIIPVLPSIVDIHVTAHFIEDLLIKGKIRSRNIKIGIVANRVKQNTLTFRLLEKFLSRLEIPFIASLAESQNYPFANESGLSIHELPKKRRVTDIEQWENLRDWIEIDITKSNRISNLN